MITEKIKALFSFIDFLHSNIGRFQKYNDLIKDLELLKVEKNKLNPESNYKDKLRFDTLQSELESKFENLQVNTANVIKVKASELDICNFDNEPRYNFNGVQDEIKQLKENFISKDLAEIFKHKNKYIEYRNNTHKTYLSMSFFFEELDEITKSLFDYFKDTEQNEFESFETKTFIKSEETHHIKVNETFQNFNVKKNISINDIVKPIVLSFTEYELEFENRLFAYLQIHSDYNITDFISIEINNYNFYFNLLKSLNCVPDDLMHKKDKFPILNINDFDYNNLYFLKGTFKNFFYQSKKNEKGRVEIEEIRPDVLKLINLFKGLTFDEFIVNNWNLKSSFLLIIKFLKRKKKEHKLKLSADFINKTNYSQLSETSQAPQQLETFITDEVNENYKLTNNSFDEVEPTKVYQHFKILVDNGYISQQNLNDFLSIVFERNGVLPNKIEILKSNSKTRVKKIFYTYFETYVQSKYGSQKKYIDLLCNNFTGFNAKTLSTNFSK